MPGNSQASFTEHQCRITFLFEKVIYDNYKCVIKKMFVHPSVTYSMQMTWWNTKSPPAGHSTWIRTRYQSDSCQVLTYHGMFSPLTPGWIICQCKIPVLPIANCSGTSVIHWNWVNTASDISVMQRENYMLCNPLSWCLVVLNWFAQKLELLVWVQ